MILSAREVCKSYGSRGVLEGVSLSCHQGEIVGLIGPNGAGKSTLFRILLGLVRPDYGSLEIHSTVQKPLGGIIEKPALYGYLSAYDNLKVFSGIQGLKFQRTTYLELMAQVGLSPERSDPVRNYSMGMKQRLGLAIALLNHPECIILDEPFSGLDPIGIRALQNQVRMLAEQRGIGVLISSHNLVELGDLCDTLYVINQGEIIKHGPALEILNEAAMGFLLSGKGLENSIVLKQLKAEIRKGSAFVVPEDMTISEVLKSLLKEGAEVTGCVPQTNLSVLFEKHLP